MHDTFGVSTHVLSAINPEAHFPLFARSGFSLIELNLGYFPYLEDAQKLRDLQMLLESSGLQVWSFHLPYGGTVPSLGNMDVSHPDAGVRHDTIEAVRLCLDRLIALKGQCLVVHPSVGTIAPDERPERLALCAESLRECAAAGTSSVRIAVEALPPGSLGETSRELLALLDCAGSPALGICLDVNHRNLTEDLIEGTRRLGSRVITTHLSDNDGLAEQHWIPGEGVIPWQEWFRALLATGYGGPFIYESSQPAGSCEEETVAEIHRNSLELRALIR